MKKILLIAALSFLLVGCVKTPQMTPEEWTQATQRHYDGVSQDEVAKAVEKLFRLADGSDFKTLRLADGLYASRNWGMFVVLTSEYGTDYWLLKMVEKDGGVDVAVRVTTDLAAYTSIERTDQNLTAGPAGTLKASTMPLGGETVTGTALYDVFWARLDFLLGKSTEWMTCDQSNQRVSQGVVTGTNKALCNSFNINDDLPENVSVK